MADVTFSRQPVVSTAGQLLLHEKSYTEGIADVVNMLLSTGTALHVCGETEKVAEIREACLKMLIMRNKMQCHVSALQELERMYQPSERSYGFQEHLKTRVEQMEINRPYDPTMDEDYAALLEETGGGAPGPSGNADFDDVMEEPTQRELSANAKCPITGKEVMELNDPVVDEKNYVYEKDAILHHIRIKGGSVKAPTAGTNYVLTEKSLRPAARVIRARQRAQQRRGTQRAEMTEDDLILE